MLSHQVISGSLGWREGSLATFPRDVLAAAAARSGVLLAPPAASAATGAPLGGGGGGGGALALLGLAGGHSALGAPTSPLHPHPHAHPHAHSHAHSLSIVPLASGTLGAGGATAAARATIVGELAARDAAAARELPDASITAMRQHLQAQAEWAAEVKGVARLTALQVRYPPPTHTRMLFFHRSWLFPLF